MAPSTDPDNAASSEDLNKDPVNTLSGKRPPPTGLAELLAVYGPASFGILVAMLILGGMSAVGWLIWWLLTR